MNGIILLGVHRVLTKRLLFLTGCPGVGKTTVLLQIVEALKVKGCSVGGMISREVRSCGDRVGFEILDLSSNRRGWLAHVNQKAGPKIGKYKVNMKDLENIGVSAIEQAVRSMDVVAIDEVGPMELFSEKFQAAVEEAVESGKLVIGVVHWKARSKLVDKATAREDAKVFTVTAENRTKLPDVIVARVTDHLNASTNQG
jgi:nucleoside-triphosphatase